MKYMLAIASSALLLAGTARTSVNAQSYSRGQDVSPTFDGWEHNSDGTYTLHFGYFNRNSEEELDVPIGPDNNLNPGGDRGQPTHFYPARKWWVFKAVVPGDWPKDRRVVWTLTTHGRTNQAKGWLQRTDGRKLPSGENLEKLGPAWYGHSVGKWDGNTFVVNTVGLDERAWLDNDGNPKSFRARIEETWRRVDSNTLELQLTLYDPEYYTAPYVGSKKIYKRIPNDLITYFGWYGLYAGITEGICAPVNEVEGYNKEFRDPGRAKSTGK